VTACRNVTTVPVYLFHVLKTKCRPVFTQQQERGSGNTHQSVRSTPKSYLTILQRKAERKGHGAGVNSKENEQNYG